MSKRVASIIFVVGGALLGAEKQCLNTIEVSENMSNFRLLNKNLNEARRSPAIMQKDNKLIIIGGCNSIEHLSNSEELCTNARSISNSQLKLSHGLSCAAFCQTKDGSFYIFGGYDGQECLKSVSKIHGQSVTAQSPLINRLKNSTAIAISDDEILLFGGWDEKETRSTIFSYKMDGSQAFHAHLPYPIEGHSAVRNDNEIYVIGGFNSIQVVNSIVRYNISTKTSEILPIELKIARENHAAVMVEEDDQKYLYVIGGWNGQKALSNCEKFRILNQDPWLERVECTLELNQPRNRPAVIVMYV